MNFLITGGTGSLGYALIRHLLHRGAERVAVLSRDEIKHAQMARAIPDPRIRFMLGDVRDLPRLRRAFGGYDCVVHAAALKRVDAVADNPGEVFRTNLEGTRNVLSAALDEGVSRVLFISSDKACYPTNAYGVSKAAAESETVSWNRFSHPRGTWCSVLRYGNVLGSRGSVIHLWREQAIPEVTHPDMTRFVITMPQACQAVTWALSAMEGGEIFVPQLPATRILDLLSAVTGSRAHRVVGLRPGGEKLHETLLTLEEIGHTVDTGEGYWAIRPTLHEWRESQPWEGYRDLEGAYPRTSAEARVMTMSELWDAMKHVPTEGI